MAIGLGWKKFSFFEQDDRPGVAIPEETTCSSGSQHHVAFGCSGGQVCSPAGLIFVLNIFCMLYTIHAVSNADLSCTSWNLQVVLFERAFTGQLAFQAHGHLVSQLICLKVSSFFLNSASAAKHPLCAGACVREKMAC